MRHKLSNPLSLKGSGSTKIIIFMTLVLSLVLLWIGQASAAISFNSASSGSDTDEDVTFSHTVNAGDNKILIVGVSLESDNSPPCPAVQSITYNGVALTLIDAQPYGGSENKNRVELWYLLNPDEGTHNVVSTLTGPIGDDGHNVGAITINGAAQQAPEASNKASGDSSTASVSVTTQTDGAWVIDVVGNSRSSLDQTAAAGQMERWEEGQDAHSNGSTRPVATAGAATMSWTLDSSRIWAIVAASFAPAGAAVTQYTIEASAGSNGSITPSGSVTVNEGDDQGFTITPALGYAIADVKVDGSTVGAVNFYEFTDVRKNYTIVASFVVGQTYTITATAGNNGSISPSGSVVVNEGADQPFTITPDTGYVVADVKVDGGSEGAITSYEFTDVSDNHTIEASFVEGGVYTISAAAYNGGSISPSGTITLLEGDTQTFTITPDTGNSVLDVEIDGVSVGPVVTPITIGPVISSHSIVAYFDADECVDLSSVPLGSLIQAAPANIMLVIDDSDSMDSEILTTEDLQYFHVDSDEHRYVFNNPGDNHNSDDYILSGDDRWRWMSQFWGYNMLYYNPSFDYKYWPTLADADLDNPVSLPCTSCDLNMNAIYRSGYGVDVRNAHYYTFVDGNGNGDYDTGEDVYLVVIEGQSGTYSIHYYLATISGTGSAGEVTNLAEVFDPSIPPAVKSIRSAEDERQNFANWYSYHRRRQHTGVAAMANFVTNMSGVRIGLCTIDTGNVQQPVLSIKAGGVDQTSELLDVLYSVEFKGNGTPLRRGLEAVGKYFNESQSSGIGSPPWATAAEGGECQQAFAIVLTDGAWNGSNPSVGDADGDNGPPYADSVSNTLADVAMYYYENDLAGSLENHVPANPLDDAPHQHMVTYTVSFGVPGTLNPEDYDEDLKDKVTGQYIQWPDPGSGSSARKIDDTWHAAVNGRGSFLSAKNPAELVNGLRDIMENIESRIGSASSVSVNGDQLYGRVGADILMFQSTYDPDGWIGDVKAYQIDTNSGAVLMESYNWSAAEQLDARVLTTNPRAIATWDPVAEKGRELQYIKLKPEEKFHMNSDPTMVNFLRGDRNTEVQYGGTFRNRYSRLGDVVHSSPIFVDGDPNGYLYVGANDGMMHCLDASTGEEVFAYMPWLVIDHVAALADIEYGLNHNYYVDRSPVITPNVDAGGGSTMTLLVGGLGNGGKGYYALDVTHPETMTDDAAVAGKVLWEFPREYGSLDNDLGYTFGKPTIVNSNDNDINSNSTGWVVIAGNGYNSASGKAVLFILDPFDGTVLKRIDVGNGPCNGLSTPAAVDADPDGKVDYVYAGDLKGNLWKFDLTDEDYTNWEVAYKDGTTPKPLFQCPGQPITTQPDVMVHCRKRGYMVIFGTGKYLGAGDFSDNGLQSIFGIWDYGDDDDDSEYLGTFIRGVTPQLSNQPDTVTLLRQSFVPSPPGDANSPFFWTVGDNKVRILTDNTPLWTTTTYEENGTCIGAGEGFEACDLNDTGENPDPLANVGWYFDLPIDGERVVSDVMIRMDKVIAISFVPEEDPCGTGGESIIHEIDACTGARLDEPQFDIDGSGTIGSGDLINIGTVENPNWVAPGGILKDGQLQPPAILSLGNEAGDEMKYYSGSSGDIKAVKGPAVTLGISHWREYR